MLANKVTFDKTPERITIEELPGGVARVILRANIREEDWGTETEMKIPTADEAVFRCTVDECPGLDELAEDFDSWWEYAASYAEPKPMTQEEMEAKIFYLMAMQEG